uniref:Uncharacterized protein n=1 Tax=Leersia perrieri TaxID=77586 RepID=A0A0D9X1E1_9ORYZ
MPPPAGSVPDDDDPIGAKNGARRTAGSPKHIVKWVAGTNTVLHSDDPFAADLRRCTNSVSS